MIIRTSLYLGKEKKTFHNQADLDKAKADGYKDYPHETETKPIEAPKAPKRKRKPKKA